MYVHTVSPPGAESDACMTSNYPPCTSCAQLIRKITAIGLQAEFERKKALAAKPEKLEEAVEKLVRWRIESEKVRSAHVSRKYMCGVTMRRWERVLEVGSALWY